VSAITESARGEECLVRIPGVCKYAPEYTIWSHCRHIAAGRGKGIKSVDLAGAYCCTACDAVYDGQARRPKGMSKEQVDADWAMGHFRTLVRMSEKGMLK